MSTEHQAGADGTRALFATSGRTRRATGAGRAVSVAIPDAGWGRDRRAVSVKSGTRDTRELSG